MTASGVLHRGCRVSTCNGLPLPGSASCFSHGSQIEQQTASILFSNGALDLDLSHQTLSGWRLDDLIAECEVQNDLRQVRGSIDISAAEVRGSVNWRFCEFHRRVDMVNTFAEDFQLDGSVFRERPFIHEAAFDGAFNCNECDFLKGGILGEITAETIRMRDCKFGDDVRLAPEGELVDLSGCSFEGALTLSVLCDWDPGRAILDRLKIRGTVREFDVRAQEAQIRNCEFYVPLTLEFSGDWLDFEGTNCVEATDLFVNSADVNFRRARFASETWMSGGQRPDSIYGNDPPRVVSLERARVDKLRLSQVDLSACFFARAEGLEDMRFEDCHFAKRRERAVIADELVADFGRDQPLAVRRRAGVTIARIGGASSKSPAEVGATYRQLRVAREQANDWLGANDFYFGEMDLRRVDNRRSWVERRITAGYRIINGYGLKASYAFGWLAAVLLLASAAYSASVVCGPTNCSRADGHPIPTPSSLAAVLHDAVRMTSSHDSVVSTKLTLVQVAVRILIPALLALAAFAIRARVRR